MNFSQYDQYLASAAAAHTSPTRECAICLEDLALLSDDQQSIVPTCRLACGHTFHNKCVLLTYKSNHRSCPLCRLDMFPRYPKCGYCLGEMPPSVPVTTMHCCGTRLHMLCSNTWLLGGRMRQQLGCPVCRRNRALLFLFTDEEEEARRLFLDDTSSSSSEDGEAGPSSPAVEPSGDDDGGHTYWYSTEEGESFNWSSVEPTDESDDDVVVVGEVARVGPTSSRRFRARSPIVLHDSDEE